MEAVRVLKHVDASLGLASSGVETVEASRRSLQSCSAEALHAVSHVDASFAFAFERGCFAPLTWLIEDALV